MDARSRLLRVAAELDRREREAMRLFAPQPQQQSIFTSRARRLLIRGGNRSGKTLSGACRLADTLARFNQFGLGKALERKKNLKVLCVSLDFTLMSENIYRKMFEPGAFEVCGECLCVRHQCGCEGDWHDRAEPAPPLVPPRLVKEIAWLDKRRGIPAKAWLKTDVTIDFRSTDQGRAKFQGIPWDAFWCDEEATNDEEIMNEIERGMIDRRGYGQITATPLAASLTMVNWSEAAGEEVALEELRRADGTGGRPKGRFYEEVQLYTDDNTALDQDAIDRFFEGMGEEEEGVRRTGEFLVQQGLVYGREFDKNLHVVDTFPVPDTWTVYEIQDPGHAVAFATLYWAVSPEGNHYLFDELYLRRQDIPDVVRKQKKLLGGDSPALATYCRPQRSLVDPAATQVSAGMRGRSVLDQIHRERKKQNHVSWQGTYKCYKAHNEVRAGIFAVKALLKADPDTEKPRLFVMRHLHHFLREVRRYRWPRPASGKDLVEKQGPLKKDDHLMDCLRYGALARFEHVPPEQRPGWGSNPKLRKSISKFLKDRRKKKEQKIAESYTLS